MLDLPAKNCLTIKIPSGGERVPLCSSITAREMDGSDIELITAECSDLLLRGCTRGSPVHSTGLFYRWRKNDSRKAPYINN
jgi:hypothetical protein